MSQVVQAKCPHCQNVLRIPAAWVDKAMRCKSCKQTFQAKAKSSSSTSSNAPIAAPKAKASAAIPVAKPASGIAVGLPAVKSAPSAVAAGAPPIGGSPFGFDLQEPAPSSPRRRSKGGGSLLLVTMFFFLFLLGLGAVGIVGYKVYTSGQFTEVKNSDKKDNKVAANNPIRNVPDDTKKKTDGEEDKSKTKDPPRIDTPRTEKEKERKKITTPPKKDKELTPPPKDKEKKEGPKIPAGSEPFPRRALLISVNNYLFYNTVQYGSELGFVKGYPGSSTGVLRDRFTRPPMNFPANQVTELSDGIPSGKPFKPHSTQRSVIETTIKDFVDGSRAQDRVVILFAGHAASVDGKSYLVPMDGNLKDVESLVTLKFVYDQLAACKAQQKIFILDAFRFSPARGSDLGVTGEGEEGTLPEAFDKDINSPPPGVQVWCACSKHPDMEKKENMVYESSIELEGGSAFLQALCNSLQGGASLKGISNPMQPIPIEALVKDVNDRLKTLAEAEKRVQVSQFTGKPSDALVAYNKDEALPSQLTLKPPTVPAGAQYATKAEMASILEFFTKMPPVRESRQGDQSFLNEGRLPPFLKSKLEQYKSDTDKDFTALHNQYKTDKAGFAKEFPLRAAVFDAIDAMEENNKQQVREVLFRIDSTDPKRKNAFLLLQEPIGQATFKLERAHDKLVKANEMREMETSRRWRANYDYMRARLQSRLIYLMEYNYTLASVRADRLPDLTPAQTGWRLGSVKKITVNERKAKDLAKETKTLWNEILKDYPDTPWALLAAREKEISLGLQWRPKSD